MANTQTTVPLFVANTVLTAAQQNISAGTGVPVFATTVTRDAAFGGSNKALAEGQLAYIEASNVVQYYDGAAWATVGPLSSGLVCVKAQTAFSVALTLNVDNVFTSSYSNYKILLSLTAGSGSITMRLRASSTDTTTNYKTRTIYGTSSTLFAADATGTDDFYLFDYDAQGGGAEISVIAPQLAQGTTISTITFGSSGASGYIYNVAGYQNSSTQFDGFSMFPATTAMTGTYAVYGYSKTV